MSKEIRVYSVEENIRKAEENNHRAERNILISSVILGIALLIMAIKGLQ